MKILFLDVDGVLNSQDYFKKLYNKHGHGGISIDAIDDKCVEYLSILHKKGLFNRIVVHSTWRQLDSHKEVLETKLKEYNLSVYDYTNNCEKSKALIDYIETLETWDNYIILEDELIVDYPQLNDKIYLVDRKIGLTMNDAKKLLGK